MLFFYRKLLLAVVILAGYYNPLAQVLVCMIMQLIYTIFLLHFKPYRDANEQRLEVANEMTILANFYVLMTLIGSFFTNPKASDKAGYIFIGIVCISFVINFTPMLYLPLKSLFLRCKRHYAIKKVT